MKPKVYSAFCGMGLLDRAFLDAGFDVVPLCEIDPAQRALYRQLCDDEPLTHDVKALLNDLNHDRLMLGRGYGFIGGPPCQGLSRMKSMRAPKFPDMTPQVKALMGHLRPSWFLLENVAALNIDGSMAKLMDAMHYGSPHQSRPRWFTYSPNITPPQPLFAGSVDDLMAYPVVAGRIYGPKRGAILQGYPQAADIKAPCADLQLGLANAVHYDLGRAWAASIMATLVTQTTGGTCG